jgi:hypothetical protein
VPRPALVLVLLALTVPAVAAAGTPLKTARSGVVSLQVPAAWKVVSRRGPVPLVAAATRPVAGYHPNVTVVTGTPRGSRSAEAWRRQVVSGLRAPRGGTLASRVVRLPAGRAVEVSVRGTVGRRGIRWLLYALDTRPRSYVVTFTSGARAWPRYADLFRRLARTVRVRR